jgi:pimeloyl-ACP methyl ester carboxylesterase
MGKKLIMIVHINQIDLYFEELGAGTPVVLLHGYPLDHTIWQEVVPTLAKHARVIAPDLRGHGRTDAPQGGIYSMRQVAEDVAGLLDALEVPQAVVVGHSMGGYAALAFAQAYSQRLLGLGMVTSQAAADTPERRAGRLVNAEEVQQNGMAGIADSMPARLTTQARLVPILRSLILATRPRGAAGILRGMAERPDMTPFLTEITVPAVVIAGALDLLVPMDKSVEMAQKLPDARLVMIPEAGHMAMMEFPERVAEELLELVRRSETSPSVINY